MVRAEFESQLPTRFKRFDHDDGGTARNLAA
jgi:hypothetical protein